MPFSLARKNFAKILSATLRGETESLEQEIAIPPNPAMGDLSLPVFSFSDKLKKTPNETALTAAKMSRSFGMVERIEARGPYINAFLNRQKFAREVITRIQKDKSKYGLSPVKKGKPVVLEFVSPNTNKPLHLGHLRNAFLGSAISKLILGRGGKVINSILYNDRGIHIMKSMLAYSRWGENATPGSAHLKGDHFVGKYYVMFEQKAKESPGLEAEAQEWLVRWEKGDKKLQVLWKKMNKWAEEGFNGTLERLGVVFSATGRESALYKKGKKIVFDALKKGIFTRDAAGNIIAPLAKFNLPDKVVLRADGTAVYATTDIALARERWRKYHFGRLIYVVGMEQDLHFKQLFKIFELLGEPYARLCEHLSYNWVFLPEGRMKSREGRVVDADALLDELWRLALEEVKSRYELLKQEKAEERAEMIAQSALKYYLLEVDPKSDIHFNPAASLAFSGRTGPYIQYSHARISSLLRKAGKLPASLRLAIAKEITDVEHRILMLLGRYEEVLETSLQARNPSGLAKHLYELAKTFSDFYEKEPVLKSTGATRQFRLLLSKSVGTVLSSGLGILGIKAPEEM